MLQLLLISLSGLGAIILGIVVLLTTRMVAGPRDLARDDSMRLTLSVVGWVLIVVGAMACSLAAFNPLGILFWWLVVVVLIGTFVRHRSSQRSALLWLMASAAERLIPLAPALEAFARECGGVFGNRIWQLCQMLSSGVPLTEAFYSQRRLFPADTLPIIEVGYQSGALAEGLRRAAATQGLRKRLWLPLANHLTYAFAVVPFGGMILLFMMIKIVPSFQKIFQDFDMELPAMAIGVISVAEFFAGYWYLFALALIMLAGLLFLYELALASSGVRLRPPGLGRLSRRLDTATILDALSLAAENHRPLTEAVASLARSYPNRWIRRQLQAVSSDLQSGADWCESLLAHGLIGRADGAILQSAARVGNLAWAMREMADSNRRRFSYRLDAVLQIVFPPIVVGLGMLVALFVVAMFMPLISLIQSLV